jgi:hypothetical protein
MKAKDLIIGSANKSSGQSKRRIRRIEYIIEKRQDPEGPGAELQGDKIYVSLPDCIIFNEQLINHNFELPRVTTPATMAVFLPPLAPAPIFKFT